MDINVAGQPTFHRVVCLLITTKVSEYSRLDSQLLTNLHRNAHFHSRNSLLLFTSLYHVLLSVHLVQLRLAGLELLQALLRILSIGQRRLHWRQRQRQWQRQRPRPQEQAFVPRRQQDGRLLLLLLRRWTVERNTQHALPCMPCSSSTRSRNEAVTRTLYFVMSNFGRWIWGGEVGGSLP